MKIFNEKELKNIYSNIVKKNKKYFKKYKKLPDCPVKKWNFNWKNHDLPRNFCILDFIEWTKKHNLININSLGYTCDTDPELEFINSSESYFMPYPPNDLHILESKFINKFDFFIFNQTIEHLYNPFIALTNIYKYIKTNGYIFTSVPTINIPHNTPIHYNGYNPMGLTLLFMSTGFKIIEIGQWGNYNYIKKLFNKHCWPDSTNCSHKNEEKNVVQCWVLAKKY